jgi:hypothetical protein
MKQIMRILIIALITLFPGTYAVTQSQVQLKAPPIAIVKAGIYASDVEEAGNLLALKKIEEFYVTSKKILDVIQRDRNQRREEKDYHERHYGVEDVAALEWLGYYVASAPFIYNDGEIGDDIQVKRRIALELWFDAIAIKASRLSTDSKKLDVLHCEYLSVFIFGFKNINTLAKENYKKAKIQSLIIRNSPKSTREQWDAYMGQLRNISVERSRFSHAVTASDSILRVGEEPFVRKLTLVFPKNAVKIREFIKNAGYPSELEIACLLQRTLGRSKSTDYLFHGLPSEKRVNEWIYLQEKNLIKDELKYALENTPPTIRANADRRYKEAVKAFENPKLSLIQIQEILTDFEKENYNMEESVKKSLEMIVLPQE